MQPKFTLAVSTAAIVLIIACDYSVGIKNTMKEPPLVGSDSAIEPAIPAVATYYSDTLPCADCQGIVTKIVFNSDSTFLMTELYLGEDKVPKGTLGRWTQDNDVVMLDAGKDSYLNFRIVTKALQMLDKEGKEIAGKADYTLDEIEKGDINPREPFTAVGSYVYMAD